MKTPDYLLNRKSLPLYKSFSPEDAEIFLDDLIVEAKSVISEIEDHTSLSSWENVMEPLSIATEKISRIWSAVNHLNSVMDSPEWRKITNNKMSAVTEFWTQLSQNSRLARKTEEWDPHRSSLNACHRELCARGSSLNACHRELRARGSSLNACDRGLQQRQQKKTKKEFD